MKNFTEWLNNRDPEMLNEIKKPFKNFNKEKNHPEGGLKPSYAKKLGIHAGIETKREAERKGGVDKMSDKTKARRKKFKRKVRKVLRKATQRKSRVILTTKHTRNTKKSVVIC